MQRTGCRWRSRRQLSLWLRAQGGYRRFPQSQPCHQKSRRLSCSDILVLSGGACLLVGCPKGCTIEKPTQMQHVLWPHT
jgi:hypothetical protein